MSWRSIFTGYALMVGVFVLMVAASYPRITLAVIGIGAGMYGLYRIVRWARNIDDLRISGRTVYRRRAHKPR